MYLGFVIGIKSGSDQDCYLGKQLWPGFNVGLTCAYNGNRPNGLTVCCGSTTDFINTMSLAVQQHYLV